MMRLARVPHCGWVEDNSPVGAEPFLHRLPRDMTEATSHPKRQVYWSTYGRAMPPGGAPAAPFSSAALGRR
jgi:hypothetical protein